MGRILGGTKDRGLGRKQHTRAGFFFAFHAIPSAIERVVEGITSKIGSTRPAVRSNGYRGVINYGGDGKPFDVHRKIADDLEESTRFVCRVLNYSPTDVWKLNCYEFFRDLVRAHKITDAQKKQHEQWQTKR